MTPSSAAVSAHPLSSANPRRLVVADVHLRDDTPHRTHQFVNFLRHQAGRADELYLLGDVVDAWLGDDDDRMLANTLRQELSALTVAGVRVLVQRGNHDFLLGARFCDAVGAMLLADEYVLSLADGRRLLLMHGDTLCGDREYMRYRRWVRGRLFAAVAKLLPLAMRGRVAQEMLGHSQRQRREVKIQLSLAAAVLRRHHCAILLHGHTHAAGEEQWQDEGQKLTRYCLPAWEVAPGFINIDERGVSIHYLPSAT